MRNFTCGSVSHASRKCCQAVVAGLRSILLLFLRSERTLQCLHELLCRGAQHAGLCSFQSAQLHCDIGTILLPCSERHRHCRAPMALLLGATSSLLSQRQASCAQCCSTSQQQHVGQLAGTLRARQYAGTLGASSSSSGARVQRLAAPLGLPALRQQSRQQRGQLQIVAGGGGGGLGGHGGGPGRPVRGSGAVAQDAGCCW